MKPSRFLHAFRKRLSARLFLGLLQLLQPVILLVGDEHDDLAKLSSLTKQYTELYQAGKFKEAIPITHEFLEFSEKAFGPGMFAFGSLY